MHWALVTAKKGLEVDETAVSMLGSCCVERRPFLILPPAALCVWSFIIHSSTMYFGNHCAVSMS